MAANDRREYWKAPDAARAESPTQGPGNDLSAWAEPAPGGVDRRDFLRAAGFTAALALASGCSRAPVEHALPLLSREEGVVPGRARYYATVCGACEAGCGVLAKQRDGRPIKLEGMPEHPLSRGGLCAVGQAALLGLYDSHRFAGPQRVGARGVGATLEAITWAEADAAIGAHLERARARGGRVRILTGTLTSPTLRHALAAFLDEFADDACHVVYDALSSAAVLDAHEETHGLRALPRFHFELAEVVVGFDADFLGTWISPVEYAAGYRQRRRLDGAASLSYHAQFESRMSLTGSNADHRHRIAPDEIVSTLAALDALVAARLGGAGDLLPLPSGEGLGEGDSERSLETTHGATRGTSVDEAVLAELAERLAAARGRSLVVCGSQDPAAQRICNALNQRLGNYGTTVALAAPSYQRQGDDAAVAALIEELQGNGVDALIVAGVNPVYDLPEGAALATALERVPLVIYCGERPNETSRYAHYICPDHHFLESWGDAEPVAGIVALRQPLLRPLFDTRALVASLAAWGGAPQGELAAVRDYWQQQVYPKAQATVPFTTFWERTLHDGWAQVLPDPVSFAFRGEALPARSTATADDGFTLVLYPKVGLLDGRHAYNPWLQELPDPVSKVTWDNYACLSVAAAQELGVVEGDVLHIECDGMDGVLELPAYIQPGQHDRVVALALGYGQETTVRFAGIGPQWIQGRPSVGEDGRVGVAVSSFLSRQDGRLRYERGGARITHTGRRAELATTQTHHTITVPEHLAVGGSSRRPLIQEATLDAYRKDPHAGSHAHHELYQIYPEDHPKPGHHWAMAVDLSACTGCSACVIACQAENNIPVVGKDEVRRHREMHWMRIDRYYSGTGDEVDVAHQPMLCQHCEYASCENVCPVLATVHTEEGLNAQVYNRCVGTRYCANNRPYKVRRFNWFRYRHDDALENMVLNPDVTVRSRGIMEKCSFCVQRIQEAKLDAKRQGVPLADGAVQPACQQSCPMQAIVFGDLNDPESRIAQQWDSARRYRVLEEVNLQPSVGYLTLVRNRKGEAEGAEHHG